MSGDYVELESQFPPDNMNLAALNVKPTFDRLPNKASQLGRERILSEIGELKKWRYHHGLDELKQREDTYHAYCRRIDCMKDMLRKAFGHFNIQTQNARIADLAASEGFFSNFMVEEFGAKEAHCFEINLDQVHRAHLIQSLKGIGNVEYWRTDFETTGWALGMKGDFDIVLCLGIIYHLQNPFLFLRNLYEVTKNVAVVESDTPVVKGDLHPKEFARISLNRDVVTLEPGVVRQLIEFRPNRDALVAMLHAVGFRKVVVLPPSDTVEDVYFRNGEKSMLLAFK